MTLTLTRNSLDFDQLLYQAVADNEFRTALLDTPSVFGLPYDYVSLPDPVEKQDQASLERWNEGIAAISADDCASSCSFGPFTIVCDGTTK